ncbi:MAG TPA: GAF domain-containing protein [Patescibacteria group bacterium]|nr:GAF domain-containing protein [Patescibacteria group bacterium]
MQNEKYIAIREFSDSYAGSDFLQDISLILSETLGVSYVLIGRLIPPDSICTLTLLAHGSIVPNMEYKLSGTPCDNVVGRSLCYYPCNIQALFPDDKELQELGIESYIGTPLFDENNRPIGLIVLMHTETIEEPELVESILQYITPRVQKELQGQTEIAV